MLDKLITYIVCLYKTFYQVLPVVWTNYIYLFIYLFEILIMTDTKWLY